MVGCRGRQIMAWACGGDKHIPRVIQIVRSLPACLADGWWRVPQLATNTAVHSTLSGYILASLSTWGKWSFCAGWHCVIINESSSLFTHAKQFMHISSWLYTLSISMVPIQLMLHSYTLTLWQKAFFFSVAVPAYGYYWRWPTVISLYLKNLVNDKELTGCINLIQQGNV